MYQYVVAFISNMLKQFLSKNNLYKKGDIE